MFARVQTSLFVPVMICTAGEDLKNGAPVDCSIGRELTKATAEPDYVVVAPVNFDGINAAIEPNDAAFEDIKSGKMCLRYVPHDGDVFATDQITASGLTAGDALTASSGKFVKATANGTYKYVYVGKYDNPWGLDMHAIECKKVTVSSD